MRRAPPGRTVPLMTHRARPLLPALALLTLLAAPSTGLGAGGAYKGKTDQNRAVSFKLSGGKVRTFQAGVLTYCNTNGNTRFNTDAVANLPAIPVRGGRFSYRRDTDEGTVEVKGRIAGKRASGTFTLTRPDSNYDASARQTYFGTCGAYDRKWSAKAR